MFNVQLKMYVWDSYSEENSENWILVYKSITLPFTPFIGLKIEFSSERDWRITEVHWNTDENSFKCMLQDLYSELGLDTPTFDEWLENFVENGGSIIRPHPKQE